MEQWKQMTDKKASRSRRHTMQKMRTVRMAFNSIYCFSCGRSVVVSRRLKGIGVASTMVGNRVFTEARWVTAGMMDGCVSSARQDNLVAS